MTTSAIPQSYPIPQWVPIVIAVAYYPWALGSGVPLDTILSHTLVALIAFAIAVVLFHRGGVGGGALKLTVAILLWFDVSQGLTFIALSYLSLGIFGTIAQKISGRDDDLPYWPFAALALIVMKAMAL